MMRRRFDRWIIWLLPIMVARALVPSGFMIAVQAAGPTLVLCPTMISAGAGTHSETVRPDLHHAHAAHFDEASIPPEHDGQGAVLCPFALSCTACASDAPVPANHAPRTEPPLPLTDLTLALEPIRTDRIRGPPLLA